MRCTLLVVVALVGYVSAVEDFDCMQIPIIQCCASTILKRCAHECDAYAKENCPQRLKAIEGGDTNAVAPEGGEEEESKTSSNAAAPEPKANKHEGSAGGSKALAAPIDDQEEGGSAPVEVRTPERHEEPTNCGNKESDFAPCTDLTTANNVFRACCEQYVGQECHELCQYESSDTTARDLMVRVVKSNQCSLKNLSPILYCASQNRDNRACCQHLELSSSKLNVGDRCLRMCDPGGEKLGTLTREDLVCLGNWNVIMYCHHSGLRL